MSLTDNPFPEKNGPVMWFSLLRWITPIAITALVITTYGQLREMKEDMGSITHDVQSIAIDMGSVKQNISDLNSRVNRDEDRIYNAGRSR